MNPFKSFTMLFWSLLIAFMFCQCGEMVTSQFDLFNLELSKCNWHLFSMNMQQLLIVFMANAQQPTIVCGFGNIFCVREVFRKVSFIYVFIFGPGNEVCYYYVIHSHISDSSNQLLVLYDIATI